MQLDYTWERREKLIRAEEYQDGLETGIEKGRREGRSEGIDLFYDTLQKLKQGTAPETLLAQGVDESVIQKALSLL